MCQVKKIFLELALHQLSNYNMYYSTFLVSRLAPHDKIDTHIPSSHLIKNIFWLVFQMSLRF